MHEHDHHHHHHRDDVVVRNPEIERGEGVGKVLFVDAFSGIAGDMFVAALVDLGVPLAIVRAAIDALAIGEVTVSLAPVVRSGIVAPRFLVRAEQAQPQRSYGAIRDLLAASRLPGGALALAERAFARLAEAEAAVHGVSVDDVHFHEVGAVDSIVDIVATAVGLDHLGAEVIASPMPMGRGTVRAQHGPLPLPAPATILCLRGLPTIDAGIDGELVTPTGACLIASAATSHARWPALRPERVGWGAGTRELPDRPNLLRLVLGASDPQPGAHAGFAVLETNLDDQSPEQVAYAAETLFESGALDVWTVPIGMKKGRAAVMLCALARSRDVEAIVRRMLSETASLGVRVRPVDRVERPRAILNMPTSYGSVRVKIASGDGLPPHAAPEYEDVRRLARQHGVPIKRVYEAALMASRELIAERCILDE